MDDASGRGGRARDDAASQAPMFSRRMAGVPSRDSDAPAAGGNFRIYHPRVAHMDLSAQIIDDAIAANRTLPRAGSIAVHVGASWCYSRVTARARGAAAWKQGLR
jgi:hypothetical protein